MNKKLQLIVFLFLVLLSYDELWLATYKLN